MNILYQGPVYNCSGYSQIKLLFLFLKKRGHKIKIESIGNREQLNFFYKKEFESLENTKLKKPYINFVAGIAPQLRRDPDAAYNIAYTMFETNSVPENWVKFYNEVDEIWTPSTFCENSLNRKDIKCIVKVIPFGINEKIFKPSRKRKQKDVFTFLSVGKWIDRKGWDLLINAYTAEFMRVYDVRLCIKTDEQTKTKIELVKDYLVNDQTSHMPRILINNQKTCEEVFPLFYQEADCYILPSRGEAYGIPYLEAMSSGIPVIASDFGGQLDFINEENGWLIPIRSLVNLSERLCKINSAYKGLWFAEPQIKDIRKLMRYAYENKKEVKQKGIKARKIVKENYTWKKIVDLAEKRLKEIWDLIL